MKFSKPAILFALLATSCTGPFKIIDTALPPPSLVGRGDPDIAALVEANTILGLGAPPPATPQLAARGLADVDYIAGAFNTHIRWYEENPGAQEQILIARREIRAAIGVADATPSQALVDSLFAASAAPDDAAMLKALANPIFTLGPEATLERLRHLPKLETTPYAITHVDQGRTGYDVDNR